MLPTEKLSVEGSLHAGTMSVLWKNEYMPQASCDQRVVAFPLPTTCFKEIHQYLWKSQPICVIHVDGTCVCRLGGGRAQQKNNAFCLHRSENKPPVQPSPWCTTAQHLPVCPWCPLSSCPSARAQRKRVCQQVRLGMNFKRKVSGSASLCLTQPQPPLIVGSSLPGTVILGWGTQYAAGIPWSSGEGGGSAARITLPILDRHKRLWHWAVYSVSAPTTDLRWPSCRA